MAVSLGFTWQGPTHELADQTLPEEPGLWELLAWQVGRGVEDFAEREMGREVIWGSGGVS